MRRRYRRHGCWLVRAAVLAVLEIGAARTSRALRGRSEHWQPSRGHASGATSHRTQSRQPRWRTGAVRRRVFCERNGGLLLPSTLPGATTCCASSSAARMVAVSRSLAPPCHSYLAPPAAVGRQRRPHLPLTALLPEERAPFRRCDAPPAVLQDFWQVSVPVQSNRVIQQRVGGRTEARARGSFTGETMGRYAPRGIP